MKWLLLFHLASAQILTPVATEKSIEGVKLSSTATVKVQDRSHNLTSVGAGLRIKKIVFVKIKVYVGEAFVEDPKTLKKDEASVLQSLAEQKAVAIRMTFLRSVDSGKIEASFKDGFEANGINAEEKPLKEFLAAVKASGEFKEKAVVVIAFEKLPDGSELATVENNGKAVTIAGSAGFTKSLFSIWFGKTNDPGVLQFRNQILSN